MNSTIARVTGIQQLCKTKNLAAAYNLFRKPLPADRAIDPLSATVLISKFAIKQKQDLSIAFEIYDTLKLHGNADNHAFTALVSSCLECGQPQKAGTLWDDLQSLSLKPDHICFAQFAAACTAATDVETAFKLLQYAEQVNFSLDLRLGHCISLFLAFAQSMNVQGMTRVWQQIIKHRICVDAKGYTRFLKACGTVGPPALEIAKTIHAHIPTSNVVTDQILVAALVQMYSSCGALERALAFWSNEMQVLPVLDAISYSTILNACANAGPSALLIVESVHDRIIKSQCDISSQLHIALICVHLLCHKDEQLARAEWSSLVTSPVVNSIKPEGYVQVLTACTTLHSEGLALGKLVYSHVTKAPDWNNNLILFSAIINMFVHCGNSNLAASIFATKFPSKVHNPTSVYQCILAACDATGDWQFGQQIYQQIKDTGIPSSVRMHMSLVTLFTRCFQIETAMKLWKELAEIGPDRIALITILSVCSEAGDNVLGQCVHEYMCKTKVTVDIVLGTALLLMYGRSGMEETAEQIFCWMRGATGVDVTTWSAMISIYGRSGFVEKTKSVLACMREDGIQPNIHSFSSLIHACAHTGHPDNALQYYQLMQTQHSITPTLIIHNCVVDALSRANRIQQAINFIKTEIRTPDVVTWKSVLGAARLLLNVEFAELAFKEILKLDDRDPSTYILMANTYALVAERGKEAGVRKLMEAKCEGRVTGMSRITINGRSHWFAANDTKHPEIKVVDEMWRKLSSKLTTAGYYPDTSWVCREGSKELKVALLCRHSEKLAICYGLVKTEPGTPLFVIKNLRGCGDCHYATLMISLITKRKIVVRDARRYHHFENGQCSCGGFW